MARLFQTSLVLASIVLTATALLAASLAEKISEQR
jgi:hypothetical protein